MTCTLETYTDLAHRILRGEIWWLKAYSIDEDVVTFGLAPVVRDSLVVVCAVFALWIVWEIYKKRRRI